MPVIRSSASTCAPKRQGDRRWLVKILMRYVRFRHRRHQFNTLAEFDDAEWKDAKLHPDCYVVVEATYYSVPYMHLLTPMQNSPLGNADKILGYFGGSPCTHTKSAFGR